ncbi:MAG: RidA family protein [Phycisphaerae bacterium]|nr:RidA family protein [Phycisphaerae bacterium]
MRVQFGDTVLLLISGTASVGPNGESLHPGDLRRQARRTFDNIKALLHSEAADWHDVVRTTVYLADMRDYDAFNEVRNAFYREETLIPFPASTCVEARLCRPDLLVEIEAMAVIPANRRA